MSKSKFWYSEKQATVLAMSKSPKNVALIDGKEVVYTTMSDSGDHGCNWDDMVYLGDGEWLKVIGTWSAY